MQSESLALHALLNSEEATEVLADAEGRWFSFSASNTTMLLLEKKGLPDHLQKMECVDTVISLQGLICELQDAGEVPLLNRLVLSIPSARSKTMFGFPNDILAPWLR